MLSFKDILRNPKVIFESKRAESEKKEEKLPSLQKRPSEENIANQAEVEDAIDQPVDYNCIASDFTDDMLALEMMRLARDPANMDREQMIEILYKQMDSQKPIVEEIITQENN